ncbi:MAG: LysR substrate-binding domain-containing protein [Hyphomicrobiales bacterium]
MSINPRCRTNSGLCALTLVAKGAGIGLLPSFAVVSELRDGRIRNLLPGWNERTGPASLVWSPLAPRKRRVKSLIGCRAAGFPAWAGAQQA